MKAYWYTDNPDSTFGNVGDMLTPIIIEHFTGKKPEFVPHHTKGKLLACGSVAEFIQLTSKIIGGYFKYEDYVSGRGNPELLKKVFMDWYKSVED